MPSPSSDPPFFPGTLWPTGLCLKNNKAGWSLAGSFIQAFRFTQVSHQENRFLAPSTPTRLGVRAGFPFAGMTSRDDVQGHTLGQGKKAGKLGNMIVCAVPKQLSRCYSGYQLVLTLLFVDCHD